MQGRAHAGLRACHACWAQPIFCKDSWQWLFCEDLTWKANESDTAAASAEEGQVCGAHLQAAAQDAGDDGGVRDHGHCLPAVLVRGRLQHAPSAPAALPERIHRLCSTARICCHLRTGSAPLGICCHIRLAYAGLQGGLMIRMGPSTVFGGVCRSRHNLGQHWRWRSTSEASLPSNEPQSRLLRSSESLTGGVEKPAKLCRSAMLCAVSFALDSGLL